jgi:hypothetical protein
MRLAPFFLAAALGCAQDRAAIERFTMSHQQEIMAEFADCFPFPMSPRTALTSAAMPSSSEP